MADINMEIENFRSAVYGKDVRGSLILLAEKVNTEVENNTAHVDESVKAAENASQTANRASQAAQDAVKHANDISASNKKYVDDTVTEYKQYADNQLAATTEKASQASASAAEAADSAGTAQQAARTADEKATAAGNSAEDAKKYAQQAAGTAGFDGSASTVSTTDTHSLGSTNVQGQLDALAVGLKNIDVEVAGKDISETVIDTLDTITDSFPVPAAKERGRTFFGKTRKFIQDCNAMKNTLLTLSKIVNNGLTTEEGYVADARQLNPGIEGTLANQLRITNSNLAGQEYVLLDLNMLTDSSQNGYTKSCTNVPPGTENGYLEVVSNKRGLALQRYTPYSSNITYIRQMLADGTWGSWRYSTGNVTSANIAAVTIQPGSYIITPTNLQYVDGDIPIAYGTGGHGAHMIITPSVVNGKWNVTRRNPYSSALASTEVKLYILRTS